MHEGAVRVMAEGAGGRTLLVPGGTACGGVVMAPAGKAPKTKGRRRQVKGVHGVLPDREEAVRESVNKDAMQIRNLGRTDFTAEHRRRARRDTLEGRGREGERVESRLAPV